MPLTVKLLLPALIVLLIGGCTDYDHTTPDTAANRAGFQRHLGQAPTEDVKGVYYYADEMGADVVYQLRFEADPATVQTLSSSLGLSDREEAMSQSVARDDLTWWSADQIDSLTPMWKTNASEDHYWMLWYDQDQREAFFLEFTL